MDYEPDELPPHICDEHEWAGHGDCPGCLRDYPEEVAAMHKRMGYSTEKD